MARDNNNTPKIGQSLVMMANLNMEKFQLAEAIQYLGEANTILRQMGDTYTLAINQGRMAVIYTDMVKPEHKPVLDKYFGGDKQKALDAALAKMDSSMVVIKQVGDLSAEQIGYLTLTNIYDLKGDYFNALQNHIQYKVLSDSLLNMERDKKLTQTAMQYEFDKKQAIDKAEQDKKDARQATIRNSIAGVLGGSLIFLFVVVRQRNRISQEKQRSEELLLNILPEEVAEELKAKGAADAKHFDRATILFTDFKNFTEMSEKMSPAELVEELNKCFKVFDELMVKYRIEKIKTIGDAYMAAGGLPDAQHGSPADVVRAALEMQSFMVRHREEREAAGKPFFEMRLGIHTGPVVAGIVGVKKFQYDIWGDTVNMASRMESSGEVGHVNISEATYAEVKDTPGFVFTHRGMIHAKGKGEVDMWFVES
jgi:adenylate cyclase